MYRSTVRIHQEDYFGNTVLTWAKLNNKIAEKPERLRALGTENSLSPQSYWFTDQPTAVLAIWQATSGKYATTSQSFLFLNKAQLYKDPKYMKGKKEEEVETLICVLLAFFLPRILLNQNENISCCTVLHYSMVTLTVVYYHTSCLIVCRKLLFIFISFFKKAHKYETAPVFHH